MKTGRMYGSVLILLSLCLILINSAILAQSVKNTQALKASKSHLSNNSEVRSITSSVFQNISHSSSVYFNPSDLSGSDTLNQDLNYNVSFTFSPGDVMLKWYEAPTDMVLNGCGIDFYDYDELDENASVEVKVVKLNFSAEQIMAYREATYLGYYIGDGPHRMSSFQDDDLTTGGWIDISGDGPPFAEDIWSDYGIGAPVVLDQFNLEAGEYTYVDFYYLLGYAPEIKKGEVFGIAVRNTTPPDAAQPDMWIMADGGGTYPCFKYYQDGRLLTDPSSEEFDGGWWIRSNYTWNINAVVTFLGDVGPKIHSVTELATTLSVGPRRVESVITDNNPDGGPAGVAKAILQYSPDNGKTYDDVTMTENGGVYYADIPGQSPGSEVLYRVIAEDIMGNQTQSTEYSYLIFKPFYSALVFFNGTNEVDGYPNAYYFGHDDFDGYTTVDFPHDRWAYGEGSLELFNLYDYIIEITAPGSGPSYINNNYIRDWLNAGKYNNYMIIGDEWLSVQSGREDKDFSPGSFQYDILGIQHVYNDINQYTGNDTVASRVMPVMDSYLGDALYDLQQTIPGADTMYYDPYGEIRSENHLDGADVRDDVGVDMIGFGENGMQYNIGFHRELQNDCRIVVLLYDALSLNSNPEYYWFGFSKSAPQVQALNYFWHGDTEYGNSIITFRVDLTEQITKGIFNPVTDTVYLRGVFNNWNKTATMRSEGSNNIFEYKVLLRNNATYEYKYSISSPGAENDGWEVLTDNRNRAVVVRFSDFVNTMEFFGSLYPVGIIDESMPYQFSLSQNYPNPFNPSTTIKYSLPERSRVTLTVYNILGETVAELANNEILNSGYYEKELNASSINRRIASGIYFYKITAVGDETGRVYNSTRKMLLIK